MNIIQHIEQENIMNDTDTDLANIKTHWFLPNRSLHMAEPGDMLTYGGKDRTVKDMKRRTKTRPKTLVFDSGYEVDVDQNEQDGVRVDIIRPRRKFRDGGGTIS